jgi:hypothetical protein
VSTYTHVRTPIHSWTMFIREHVHTNAQVYIKGFVSENTIKGRSSSTHVHTRSHPYTHALLQSYTLVYPRTHTGTHVHTSTYTHAYIRTHTQAHAQTSIEAHINIPTNAHAHAPKRTYAHTRIHTHTHKECARHTRIHAYTHTHTQGVREAYTHTRIHTQTHTQTHTQGHTKSMARSLRSTRNEQANMFSHVSLRMCRHVNPGICVALKRRRGTRQEQHRTERTAMQAQRDQQLPKGVRVGDYFRKRDPFAPLQFLDRLPKRSARQRDSRWLGGKGSTGRQVTPSLGRFPPRKHRGTRRNRAGEEDTDLQELLLAFFATLVVRAVALGLHHRPFFLHLSMVAHYEMLITQKSSSGRPLTPDAPLACNHV